MDKLIGQFKLQNFLRQMFCGVVFLLPFFLFPATVQLCPCVPKFYACFPQPGDLDFAQLSALAVLAVIIGTIIYHIEKNVLSYPIQIIFRLISQRNAGWKKLILPWVVSVVVVGCIIFGLSRIPNISVLLWTVVGCVLLVCLLTSVFAGKSGIVKDTRRLWIREDSEHAESGGDDKAVLKRVGTWADFIHCGQSCAIAWLLGSFLCNACLGWKLNGNPFYCHGLFLAGALLVLEIFIDWHRYQHVLLVLGDSEKGPRKSDDKG
ncbi:MAG: hypothetical protein PUD60_07430 [Akkermansia muciniphila]|nr:hypothetical protein [Akkermansia muciniphila]